MARFHELVAGATNPGDDGVSPTIYDDLTAEYDGAVDTSAAAVAQLQGENAELAAKLQAVMAHNYELLTAVSNTPDPAPDAEESTDDEVEIDPLFD